MSMPMSSNVHVHVSCVHCQKKGLTVPARTWTSRDWIFPSSFSAIQRYVWGWWGWWVVQRWRQRWRGEGSPVRAPPACSRWRGRAEGSGFRCPSPTQNTCQYSQAQNNFSALLFASWTKYLTIACRKYLSTACSVISRLYTFRKYAGDYPYICWRLVEMGFRSTPEEMLPPYFVLL